MQIPGRIRKFARSLKSYATPLLKGDKVFLGQLSEYCSVVDCLYGQTCTKDGRDNNVTSLIKNAIKNGDFEKAKELLLGLSSPLSLYEEKALEYVKKVLGEK